MTSQPSDLAPLQTIASAFAAGQLSLWDAAAQTLQALIDRVRCSRVSLWGFDSQGGSRFLRCVAFKQANEALVADDTLLCEDQYRDYFAALIQNGIFVANDTRCEPSLVAMRGAFLDSHRIGAMLDIAVTINGRAYGIVCCEQIPGPREWSPEDIAAARALVARAALLLACDPSVKIEAMQSLPIAPLDSAGAATAGRRGNERRTRRPSDE